MIGAKRPIHEVIRLRLSIRSRLRLRNSYDTGFSFGRSIGLGLLVAAWLLLVVCASQLSDGTRWEELDIMPFDPADVLTALAAITAGTIALQVLVQTAHLHPSLTLAEANRRQTIGMLALLSPAVSCMLAVFVCFDQESEVPRMLPYIAVTVVLAGMNCFIASDAVDRLLQVDRNNVNLKIALAVKELSHYRRHRLPWLGPWSKARVTLAGLVQILLLSAFAAVLGAALTEASIISLRPGYYAVICITQTLLFVTFALAARAWHGIDRTNRWHMGSLLLFVITVSVLIALSSDPRHGLNHAIAIVGLPVFIFITSMITTNNRTTWWLPSWVPGTWVRIPAALTASAALDKASKGLVSARCQP